MSMQILQQTCLECARRRRSNLQGPSKLLSLLCLLRSTESNHANARSARTTP